MSHMNLQRLMIIIKYFFTPTNTYKHLYITNIQEDNKNKATTQGPYEILEYDDQAERIQ